MMDKDMVFLESVSIAGAAATHKHSTDIVRIPAVKDHKGSAMDDRPNVSGKLYWNCVVEDEDLLASVDGSVITFYLYNGDTGTNPLVDNGGAAIDSVAITENTPTEHPKGTLLFSRALPQGQLHEYYDVYATVATQELATGKVTSWIGTAVQQGT